MLYVSYNTCVSVGYCIRNIKGVIRVNELVIKWKGIVVFLKFEVIQVINIICIWWFFICYVCSWLNPAIFCKKFWFILSYWPKTWLHALKNYYRKLTFKKRLFSFVKFTMLIFTMPVQLFKFFILNINHYRQPDPLLSLRIKMS
jgi:hypothetical protein